MKGIPMHSLIKTIQALVAIRVSFDIAWHSLKEAEAAALTAHGNTEDDTLRIQLAELHDDISTMRQKLYALSEDRLKAEKQLMSIFNKLWFKDDTQKV